MSNQEKWDKRFLSLAKEVSAWSHDPSTKVGCILVGYDNIVVGMGYNGFPKGFPDTPEYLEDREAKYKIVIHAEENAVINATHDVDGATAYVTTPPCSHCTAILAQKGISRIVTLSPSDGVKERFADSFRYAEVIRKECGINYTEYKEWK